MFISSHIVNLLSKVLTIYKVPVSFRTIERVILTHPGYPSMQCISDTLDSWKVKHVVMKLSLEKLRALDVPVIAHLKRGKFVWVTQVTETEVFFWNASGTKKVEHHDHFEKNWSGVALAIENVDGAGEPDYKEKRKKEIKENVFKYAFAGACAALLTILLCFSWVNDSCLPLLPKFLLLLVNAAGCYIGYTLIRQEKRQPSRLVQKFCKAGKNIDCHQVTASPYSKLFGIVSWAELGMAYFTTVILWMIIAPAGSDWLGPLWWFLLVPLPFTVWSLFTQAFLIRKWCLFCCAIVLLLWINAGILYFFLSFGNVFPVAGLALVVLLFLVCTAAVMYVNKTVSRDPYSGQREIVRIKFNFHTLQGQLSESCFETKTAGFVWKNSQASSEISLYVSIACSFCGAAVKELRRLTDIYPDLCYRLLFSYSTDMNEEPKAIIRHFIRLYNTMGKDEFFDMLDAWYAMPQKSLPALQEQFPAMAGHHEDDELEALSRFRQQADSIHYTPAIFINGQLLSEEYAYPDLYPIARSLNAQ